MNKKTDLLSKIDNLTVSFEDYKPGEASTLDSFSSGVLRLLDELINACDDSDPDRKEFLEIFSNIDHTKGKEVKWAIQTYNEWKLCDSDADLKNKFEQEYCRAKRLLIMDLRRL